MGKKKASAIAHDFRRKPDENQAEQVAKHVGKDGASERLIRRGEYVANKITDEAQIADIERTLLDPRRDRKDQLSWGHVVDEFLQHFRVEHAEESARAFLVRSVPAHLLEAVATIFATATYHRRTNPHAELGSVDKLIGGRVAQKDRTNEKRSAIAIRFYALRRYGYSDYDYRFGEVSRKDVVMRRRRERRERSAGTFRGPVLPEERIPMKFESALEWVAFEFNVSPDTVRDAVRIADSGV